MYESGSKGPWARMLSETERFDMLKRLLVDRGARYAASTLDNFECQVPAQRDAVAVLRKFSANMLDTLRAGGGLLLYGPEGTGKDRLQMALLKSAIIDHGCSVIWKDGLRLQDEIRSRIGKGTEHELRLELASSHILAISDPTPPKDDLNQWNLCFLRDVIDRRYQENRSTWLTCNAANIDELKPALSPQLLARLKDDSIVMRCNWQSFRQPARIIGATP